MELEYRDFYGEYYEDLLFAQTEVMDFLMGKMSKGSKSFEHCYSRVKRPASMIEKLRMRNLPIEPETAVLQITDAVGVRVICSFLEEVYGIADEIRGYGWEIYKCKDYIAHPKGNGYRSYHMVVMVTTPRELEIPVEIQIRTIAQDAWANLEHQMKYKKEIKDTALIQRELKRCADEIASTDISMQTIRELIMEAALE